MKKAIFFAVMVVIFSIFVTASDSENDFYTDEGIIFGGYCYYVENGNIYRTPISDLSGTTELFRNDSYGIMLDSSSLVSLNGDGSITVYSLTDDAGGVLDDYLSSSYDEEMLLGSLSAKYESNGNPAAISSGNDAGGVSFGAYQFASSAGVPRAFALWCVSSGKAIDIGNRLLDAYAADSNSCGERFKTEWRNISNEDADLFLLVQHEYVKEKYYDAIVSRIESNISGFDIDIYGIALKNVFWSRSVQHGVSSSYNVITRAFEAIGGFSMQSEETLIKAIYAESGAIVDTGTYPMTGSAAEKLGIAGKYMKYYSKNSSAVQVSVYRRLNVNELGEALAMLEKYGGYTPSQDKLYELTDIGAGSITSDSAILFGTVMNYALKDITEYGFFMGKTINSLIDIPISKSVTSAPIISFSASSASVFGTLESQTTYYFGIYAFIGGEYVVSDIFTFTTDKSNIYNVRYFDALGNVIFEGQVKNGDSLQFVGTLPTKPSNFQYSFTFMGWSHNGEGITSDTDIYPIFEKSDLVWNGTASSGFGGGDGSEAAPYIISSASELAFLSEYVLNGGVTKGKYFILTANILLGYGENRRNFTPIGTEKMPFSGFFDGCGYIIKGLTVKSEDFAGLFGITSNASISNIIIEDAVIEGKTSGVIIGKATANTNCYIKNCGVSGNVSGSELAGGAVGFAEGNGIWFTDISASVYVKAKVCGGIVAYFGGTSLTNSFADAILIGENCGNICALNAENTLILNCYYFSATHFDKNGEPIPSDKLSESSSYSGFNFNETWCISGGKAMLKIALVNSIDYYVYGDADANGIVDIKDLLLIVQHIASWNVTLSENFYTAADVNNDGNIDTKDAVLMSQYLANWNVSLF